MVAEIPLDLLGSVKSLVVENIDEYEIEILKNEKGQGFVGEIVFLTLTHQKTRGKQQLIVKQEQNTGEKNKDDFALLVQNEMNFYDSIWPFLQKYYEKTSGKDLNIVPKCFGTSSIGRKRIFLENIRLQGYNLYDKKKPFDDDHFRTIFKTYGIYHGISMALREQDIEQFNRLVGLQRSMYDNIYNKDDSPFCKNFVDRFREAQEYFDPAKEKHILKKLRMYEESGIELLRQCVNENRHKGVIIHGDCWSNNLMFKYNEYGKPENVMLLDFQVVCHGSPVLDLSYCMYSGASEETLNKLDDYLKLYHDSLSATLSEFELIPENIYSFKAFKKEWKKYCKSGFPLGLLVWKMKLVDQDNIPDLSEDLNTPFEVSEDFKECYKKRVRELVFHFYSNDFF